MDERLTRESVSDMLDGLGLQARSAPTPEIGPRVVGALRLRRRGRAARAAGAAACVVMLGLGVAWSLGVFLRPEPAAPVREAAARDPGESSPSGVSRLTLGHLTALTNANGGELRLPEDPDATDDARPLSPRSAAAMLQGL